MYNVVYVHNDNNEYITLDEIRKEVRKRSGGLFKIRDNYGQKNISIDIVLTQASLYKAELFLPGQKQLLIDCIKNNGGAPLLVKKELLNKITEMGLLKGYDLYSKLEIIDKDFNNVFVGRGDFHPYINKKRWLGAKSYELTCCSSILCGASYDIIMEKYLGPEEINLLLIRLKQIRRAIIKRYNRAYYKDLLERLEQLSYK